MTANVLSRLVDLWLRVPGLLRAAVPVGAMSFLWWASSQPPGNEPPNVWGSLLHNSLHVVAYAGLGGSLWLACSRTPAATHQRWRSRGALLVAAAYGVVDELHQSYVPGRANSVADVLSDVCGAALAITVLRGALGLSPRWWRAALACVAASGVTVSLATFACL